MFYYKIKAELPSKKVVYFEEMKNDLYFALHKILMNEDKESFFRTLDEHFKNTIPDFNELDLLDKIYLYFYLYIYSVRPTIELNPDSIDTFLSQNIIDLISICEQLKELEIKRSYSIELLTKQGNAIINYSIPKSFELVENNLTFEPLSSIQSITIKNEKYIVTEKDYNLLQYILTPDNYYTLVKEITNNYNKIIIIREDKIEIPLLHIQMFEFIVYGLYNSSLDNIFQLMYSLNRHLHITIQDFFLLTPLDSRVLFEKLAKDKEDERKMQESQYEKMNSKGGNNLPFS